MATQVGERSDQLKGIAQEAYTFAFPLALMETTRRLATNAPVGVRLGLGPTNLFTHMRVFPPGDFREVVRPNFDTLYSTLWFDVRDEPIVVSVPDTHGRYYMLPFLDMWTDVFAVIGSRSTGTGAGHYALVGPGWSGVLPDGMERIDAPTPIGWVIGRTQTNGPSDYDAVHEVQDGYVATPLSVWPATPTPPTVTPDPTIDMTVAPLDAVLAMSGTEMLQLVADVMIEQPPHAVDQPVLARMRRLGFRVGTPFDADHLDDEVRATINASAIAAHDRMRQASDKGMHPVVNGWAMPTFGMGVYGTDYLRRAVVAEVGLGANRVEDAIYPVLLHDANGEIPDGNSDYVLHFDADALPPADAFWSVTMYDGEGFPVPNALDRYALGDRDPVTYNPDGSLDLYLQHNDPEDLRHPNWLPTPLGRLGVTLRLYDPRPEALDGTWTPPPLQRV